MSLSNILQSVQKLTQANDAELETILKKFDLKVISSKHTLLKANTVAKEVYLLIDGCMRLYYEKEGVDISAYFFTEGMFSGAYDSFISQRPSAHCIEAVEECTVLAIDYKNFQELLTEFPKMNEFVRKVLEERFVSLHQLFTSHILDSPEERYLHLLELRPDLLNRIPQDQIATYLGITPVSLSRIRNRVTKK